MSNAAKIVQFTASADSLLAQLETFAASSASRRSAHSMRAEGLLTHHFERLGEFKISLGLDEDPICCEMMVRIRFAYLTACGPRRAHYKAELARWDAEIEADAARGAVIAAALGL